MGSARVGSNPACVAYFAWQLSNKMLSIINRLSSVIGSVVEYNVANVVARVRFPDDALLI